MIVSRVGNRVTTLAYRMSNIKPTVLEQTWQNIKTSITPPLPGYTFSTIEEQERDKGTRGNSSINKPNLNEVAQTQEINNINIDPTSLTSSENTTVARTFPGEGPLVSRMKSQITSELRILHEKNIGLNLFLNRVYLTTGCSILMALGTIHFASSIPFLVMNPIKCIGYGTLLTGVGMLGAYRIRPHTVVEEEQGYEHIKTRNGVLRSSLFVMGWVGLGLLSMPFSNMLSSIMPMIIPNMIGMTVGCFGGASIFISSMPRLPLFSYGGLIGGLLGSVLSMRLVNSFNELIYGAHFVSGFIQTLDMFVGTGVFSFFIIYNTIKARQAYLQGNPDHLQIAIRFYYDILTFIKKAFTFIFRRKVD